jgi:fatty acid desaturase
MNQDLLLRRVNALRKIDNLTNWFYLAREYAFLGLVIALTIAFYETRAGWGLAWIWNVPVTVLAVVLVGAGQHRLTTLAHEASHYMLFRNRLLNELVSDWFCMFPIGTTTHHYRVQHLAHHQYPNDPERDPDLVQMEASGHRFAFPMSPRRFVWECVIKQLLWLPGSIRYLRMRARFASTGSGGGPFAVVRPSARVSILIGIAYLTVLIAVMFALVLVGDPWLLGLTPAVLLTGILACYALLPERFYSLSKLKSDVTPRCMTLFRVAHLTLLVTALSWLTLLTGSWWSVYYLVLWLVPLGTTFAFFMILRQLVQHGNAGQGRFSNTRTFLVGRLIRFAVFPLGMDYHLPHHLFPLVPHYRIQELHQLLLRDSPEYREHGIVVEGYFFHRRPPQHRTVLELMAEPAAGT